MRFNERHQRITDRPIFPTNCLPWMMLSIDERDAVLENNKLYCRICLKPLRAGNTGNVCGIGRHSKNTGFNGMCWNRDCDRHVTLCKRHENDNKQRHKIYKQSLEWINCLTTANEQTSLLTIKEKEAESRRIEELEDISEIRHNIHLKRGADSADIFGYIRRHESEEVALAVTEDRHEPEEVALAVIEDRRKNLAHFDLAYIDVDGQKALAAFDTCSSTTLIEREFSENNEIQFERTDEENKIAGIGGSTEGTVVSMVLTNRSGHKIRINASIVDEIATIKKKDSERFEMIIKDSTEAIRKVEGYEDVKEENFQRVLGGKIQILLGLDVGKDFFPKELTTLGCGFQISEHRMKLFDDNRYLGYSGSYPAQFTRSSGIHSRVLLAQDHPEQFDEEERSVFQITASAQNQT